jgi:hypothetical protein
MRRSANAVSRRIVANATRVIFTLLAVALVLLTPSARADYAVLCSGDRLHITGYIHQGASVLLYVQGGSVVVPTSDIVRFDPEDVFAPTAHTAAAEGPFAKQIRTAAAQNDVDAQLISSVISTESNFEPRAVSRKHAMGLMQIMPETATRYAVRNVFDPAQNISAGTRYLKQLLDQYHGNVSLALAAYNAGPERVAQYGGVPPFHETQNYICRVTKKLKKLKAERPPTQPR